jgi:methyl-accepting chemotaxis protein
MLFKRFSMIPIFRRLFLAFFLAVLIPDLIILVLSLLYTQALITHGIQASETGPFTLGTILALIVSTSIVVVLGYLVNSTITRPLGYLATVAKRIRQGETGARPVVTGRDEIAIVSASINSMLDQISYYIAEARDQRDDLQGQIEHLLHEVGGVGEGDLSIQAQVTQGSLGVLADSFNYMVEALSSLVIRVKMVVTEVDQATAMTQQEMAMLVASADAQLGQINQTASTIESMLHACIEVVERTAVLDQGARQARQAAQQGRQGVEQTLEGIELIHQNARHTISQIQLLEKRSQEIDDVVRVLDDIAHQTNRLALDAAIQVALVGDANAEGFGAIAEGIRRLAEQTKEQLTTVARSVRSVRAEMITVAEAIQVSEQETSTGATRIQKTGTSLATIFGIVEQQAGEIGTIARMTEQLLRSSREISITMSTIAESTTQSSNRTRVVARSMQQLALLARQLRASVEVFKVKDVTTHQQNTP